MTAFVSTLPFWALALAFTAIASLTLGLPLLKRKGAESEGRSSRLLFGALALLLPVGAFLIYSLSGNPGAMLQSAVAEEAKPQQAQTSTQAKEETPAPHSAMDLDKSLAEQKAHLEKNPQDALAWFALGLTYGGLERWPEAETAFAEAYQLQPKEAFIVSAYAEAMAINAGRNLAGRPMELVRAALEISPQDEKALELSAVHAFQTKEYGLAAYYFRQLFKALPEDSPRAQDIQGAMREAKRLSEEQAFGVPLDQRMQADANHAGAERTLSGTIELVPEFAGLVSGQETLFLTARPVSGGGAPLAALKASSKDLPAPFLLDDSLAPLPDNVLSGHDNVTLTARISFSGNTQPQSGDLEGQIRSVAVGSQKVRLVIDKRRD